MKFSASLFPLFSLLFIGCGSTGTTTDTHPTQNIKQQEIVFPFISNQSKSSRAYSPTPQPIAAYTLEESSYLKLPSMSVDYTQGFTFSSWVTFDKEADHTQNWETIFSFGNNDSNKAYGDKHRTEIWLNRYYKSNKLYFAFTNGDRDNPCADVVTRYDVLTPNTAQHIAVSIDRDNYPHIFVDGTEVETTVAWHNAGGACSLPSTTRDLCYIGKPNDEWMGLDSNGGHRDHKDNNYLSGTIHDVKIFNQTLNASNIQSIYKNSRENPEDYQAPEQEPTAKPSQRPEPTPTPVTHHISIDGDANDWRDIQGTTRLGNTIKTYADDTFAYFLIESSNIIHPTAIWFIDADNNPATGHQATEWSSSGADFAIGTAGKLYIAKTDDAQWLWDSTTLDTAPEFQLSDGIIELKIKKSDFHLGSSYRVGARVFNDASETEPLPQESFYPYAQTTTTSNGFADIKSTLSHSGATYISVGDSTRADDPHYHNGEIFSDVSHALGEGVSSYLQATPGHTAKAWNGEGDTLTWRHTLATIPNDGSSTVVNISLGINDMRYFEDKEALLANLREGVTKILAQKPKTHIMFTMPNRMVGLASDGYIAVYKTLAKDFPMVSTEAIFASGDLTLYRAEDAQEYGESVRIHLSSEGQRRITQTLLSHIQ